MWEQLLPEVEKWDVEKLKNQAEAVDPCLVEMVDKEAKWNTVSKATLIETGPYVSKDLLDAAGIGAERDYLVGFCIAAWCIFSGRSVVADRLEKMMAEKLQREKGRTNHKPKDDHED